MEFKLLSIEGPADESESEREINPEDGEMYRTLHATKQEPLLTGLGKMRAKKIAECPECHKMVSKKTLEYSHKCSTPKPPPKEAPTEESLYEYIVKKERNNREEQRQVRQERFDKMIRMAF